MIVLIIDYMEVIVIDLLTVLITMISDSAHLVEMDIIWMQLTVVLLVLLQLDNVQNVLDLRVVLNVEEHIIKNLVQILQLLSPHTPVKNVTWIVGVQEKQIVQALLDYVKDVLMIMDSFLIQRHWHAIHVLQFMLNV